jgi:hypothetical protein
MSQFKNGVSLSLSKAGYMKVLCRQKGLTLTIF